MSNQNEIKCVIKGCNEKAELKWGLCHTCWNSLANVCHKPRCMTDGCGNKAARKDEDSECWDCQGDNCNNSCRNQRFWNCCDECFKKDQDESEDEDDDEIKCEECKKILNLLDPNCYYDYNDDCGFYICENCCEDDEDV